MNYGSTTAFLPNFGGFPSPRGLHSSTVQPPCPVPPVTGFHSWGGGYGRGFPYQECALVPRPPPRNARPPARHDDGHPPTGTADGFRTVPVDGGYVRCAGAAARPASAARAGLRHAGQDPPPQPPPPPPQEELLPPSEEEPQDDPPDEPLVWWPPPPEPPESPAHQLRDRRRRELLSPGMARELITRTTVTTATTMTTLTMIPIMNPPFSPISAALSAAPGLPSLSGHHSACRARSEPPGHGPRAGV